MNNLHSDVNRILFVRNLPYQIEAKEIYSLFSRYGSIFQVRLGDDKGTNGTAFIIFDDVQEAKKAHDSLKGFSLGGRYLIIVYWKENKTEEAALQHRRNIERQREELHSLQKKYSMD